jgi:hypothetical protein
MRHSFGAPSKVLSLLLANVLLLSDHIRHSPDHEFELSNTLFSPDV